MAEKCFFPRSFLYLNIKALGAKLVEINKFKTQPTKPQRAARGARPRSGQRRPRALSGETAGLDTDDGRNKSDESKLIHHPIFVDTDSVAAFM